MDARAASFMPAGMPMPPGVASSVMLATSITSWALIVTPSVVTISMFSSSVRCRADWRTMSVVVWMAFHMVDSRCAGVTRATALAAIVRTLATMPRAGTASTAPAAPASRPMGPVKASTVLLADLASLAVMFRTSSAISLPVSLSYRPPFMSWALVMTLTMPLNAPVRPFSALPVAPTIWANGLPAPPAPRVSPAPMICLAMGLLVIPTTLRTLLASWARNR